MESFSQQPPVAVVAAGNHKPDQERFILQVKQSRFGLWLNEEGTVRGQVELGFVDLATATPTMQALPRLCIGRAEKPRGREGAGHRAHFRERAQGAAEGGEPLAAHADLFAEGRNSQAPRSE